MNNLPEWVQQLIVGAALLAWVEARFMPRRELELVIEARRKSTHEVANKLQVHELKEVELHKKIDKVVVKTVRNAERQRWMVSAVQKLLDQAGIAYPTPPPEIEDDE